MKKGISLVSLVITIIVLIILTTAVILSFINFSVLDRAKMAVDELNKQEVHSAVQKEVYNARLENPSIQFGDDLSNKIKEKLTDKFKDSKIYTEYMKDKDKIKIEYTLNDKKYELFLDDEYRLTFLEIAASTIKDSPADYYGKTIKGYTGYAKESSGYEWQIYYSDGNNIYITTTDYILAVDCPSGKLGGTVDPDGDYKMRLNGVLPDYENGSEDITDSRVKPLLSYLNSEYGKNNKNENMKVSAYLLDTNQWNQNFKSDKAEYAIGGPTLDMFFASYKQMYPNDYLELKLFELGYKVKEYDQENYDTTCLMSKEGDKLYRINNNNKAKGQWIASPSALNKKNTVGIGYGGGVNSVAYFIVGQGIRPIVCLSSSTVLVEDGDGFKIQ